MSDMLSMSEDRFWMLLEDAFEEGFSAGFHTADNPASHDEDWENYKAGFQKRLGFEIKDE